MEYLEGDTLERRLKKGALPIAQALTHGVEIASALAAAHQAGIVHRDLKPSNIILCKSRCEASRFRTGKTGLTVLPPIQRLRSQSPAKIL